jgi:hypothetical protein
MTSDLVTTAMRGSAALTQANPTDLELTVNARTLASSLGRASVELPLRGELEIVLDRPLLAEGV